MFLMARNITQLHAAVDNLQYKLAETQRHIAVPTTKDIEVERVLLKTELKVESCFKKVIELKSDLSKSEAREEVNRMPKILWLYTEFKL
jgi:hypothetical protein